MRFYHLSIMTYPYKKRAFQITKICKNCLCTITNTGYSKTTAQDSIFCPNCGQIIRF